MHLQKISITWIAIITTAVCKPVSVNLPLSLEVAHVLAQTTADQKTEADRLLQQGIEQEQTSQFQAALQSWQQALTIYREIKDRQGEGKALGNLGSVLKPPSVFHGTASGRKLELLNLFLTKQMLLEAGSFVKKYFANGISEAVTSRHATAKSITAKQLVNQ